MVVYILISVECFLLCIALCYFIYKYSIIKLMTKNPSRKLISGITKYDVKISEISTPHFKILLKFIYEILSKIKVNQKRIKKIRALK